MMKNLAYILAFLTACGTQFANKENVNSVNQAVVTDSITHSEEIGSSNKGIGFVDLTKFSVGKLSSFSLMDWDYGSRQNELVKMNDEEIKKYFQDSELKNSLGNNDNNYYFFSIQETSPSLIITLIEEYETCCADLLLMRYDSKNRLISKEKVAGTGGDGGLGYNEFGSFTTDSIYQLTRIDRETVRDEQDTMEYRIDSVIIQFQVNEDFSFSKLDEKLFQRTQLIVN
jgi:hypothetical protein